MKYGVLRRVTAVVSVVTLIATGVNIETFSSFLGDRKVASTTRVEAKELTGEKGPKVVKELKNLRTADSTTYLLSNGLKRVEYYSDDIRYEKDGKYIDYNPTLRKVYRSEKNELEKQVSNSKSLDNTDVGKYVYTNESGDSKQYFPKKMEETIGILLKKENYAINFIPKVNGNGKQLEENVMNDVKENYEVKEVDTNEIVYMNEIGDMEFKYTSNNDGIKEEIVLNEKPESNVFGFDMNVDGLELMKLDYEETIRIVDKKTKKLVAYIEEPNIRDKNGKISYSEVSYEIEKVTNKKYGLKVVVDNDYLNNAKYPVTIDPTVVWFDSKLESAAVSNMPYTMSMNLKNTSNMSIQNKCNTYGPYIGTEQYCYIDTSNIMGGASMAGTAKYLTDMYIENATLRLVEYEKNGITAPYGEVPFTAGTVEVRSIEGEWSPDTLTWDNHPEMGDNVWAEFSCTGVKLTQHLIDLTDWAKAVVSEKIPNYGLALKAKEVNTGDTFYSGKVNMVRDDAGELRATYMLLTIDYRDVARYYGIDGVYTPTGNYSEASDDMFVQTVLGEIAISRNYNSLQACKQSIIGKGFHLNYGMRVITKDDSIKVIMPNSSHWMFRKLSEEYEMIDNKGRLTI